MLFGFKYEGEMFIADADSQADAREKVTGIGPKKRSLMTAMKALPIDLGQFKYTNIDGGKEMKTLKQWDAMWRSDRGHGRHQR